MGGANGSGNGHHGPVPALELIDVRAGYGRIEVVHGVDLVVPPASVFALLGPNGGGKSTVFHILSTLFPPTGGRALCTEKIDELRGASTRTSALS